MREPAFAVLREEFPRVTPGRRLARWLTLDYLFFRVPKDWQTRTAPAGQSFGSDHQPIVSRLRPA
jgi:endonuclease/exonuclease/phosphatase (EEP) superfamily protein YafD